MALDARAEGHAELSRFYYARQRLTDLLHATGADRVHAAPRPLHLGPEIADAIEACWDEFSPLLTPAPVHDFSFPGLDTFIRARQ
jgi:hypothetical protein